MADRRTYKEVLAVIETEVIYIKNHLRNIDQHLEKLNTRTGDNEKSIAKIFGIFKGAGIIAGSIGGVLAIVLKVLGVY